MSPQSARYLEEIAQDLQRVAKKAQRRGKRRDWHRLRTTSRRLRGALAALAGAIPRSAQPELAEKARTLTKLPAKVRDLDIALVNLEWLMARAATRSERQAAKDLIGRLSRRREKGDRKLRRKLRRHRPVRALAHRLEQAVRLGRGRAVRNAGDGVARAARKVLDRHAAIEGWEDDNRLHSLRVAVKQYRDTLRASADLQGQRRQQQAALEALGLLLDILGEHHDWSELASRLADRCQSLARSGSRHRILGGYRALLSQARQEQEARYEAYLSRFHEELPALVSPREPSPPAAVETTSAHPAPSHQAAWN